MGEQTCDSIKIDPVIDQHAYGSSRRAVAIYAGHPDYKDTACHPNGCKVFVVSARLQATGKMAQFDTFNVDEGHIAGTIRQARLRDEAWGRSEVAFFMSFTVHPRDGTAIRQSDMCEMYTFHL